MLERETLAKPSAATNTPTENSSLIDPATVLSGCGGDAALLADMTNLFEQEAPELLARVEAAVRSADAEQLRMAAHALRGLVSAFSTRTAKVAEALEQLGIDGRATDAPKLYQPLYQSVQDLREALPSLTIEKLQELV
jgi:HPt (histidine-containing phosphotransfer) domain-containing protein